MRICLLDGNRRVIWELEKQGPTGTNDVIMQSAHYKAWETSPEQQQSNEIQGHNRSKFFVVVSIEIRIMMDKKEITYRREEH